MFTVSALNSIDHGLSDEADAIVGPPKPACILRRVFTNDEAFRYRYAPIDHDPGETRVATDGHIGKDNRMRQLSVGMGDDAGEQQRLVDRRAGDDAAAGDKGAGCRASSSVLVVNELCWRGYLGVSPDGPIAIIKVERGDEVREVDIGLPERVDCADVSPVGLRLRP